MKKIISIILLLCSLSTFAYYHHHHYYKNWRLGGNLNHFGYQIFHNGRLVDGRAIRLVMQRDTPWVINRQGHIFRRTNGIWELMPGRAFHITVSHRNRVWVIGTASADISGYPIYYWKNNQWMETSGRAVRFVNRPHHAVAVLNRQNMVFVWANDQWNFSGTR